MTRTEATKKLTRILGAINANAGLLHISYNKSSILEVQVETLHVFGSYSRGSLEPNDLDLIIVYSLPAASYQQFVQTAERPRYPHYFPKVNPESALRKLLRKPGEKMDIILTQCLDDLVDDESLIKTTDLVLLWSATDRDYASKVDAIKPDPAAGRHARDHLVSLKRLDDNQDTMEAAVKMVREHQLVLTRLSMSDIKLALNQSNSDRLNHLVVGAAIGRASAKVWPFGLWWLEQEGQAWGRNHSDKTEFYSEGRTHRVHLGRPSLRWMMGLFEHDPNVEKQCLICHIKRDEPNELLIFERGPNFESTRPHDSRGMGA